MDLWSREIAFCGVDCAACSDYTEGKCPGCRRTEWPEDDPRPPCEGSVVSDQ